MLVLFCFTALMFTPGYNPPDPPCIESGSKDLQYYPRTPPPPPPHNRPHSIEGGERERARATRV